MDWGRRVATPITDQGQMRVWLFEKAGAYERLDDFTRISPTLFAETNGGETWGVVPALAIPVREKQTFECPHSHVEALGTAVWNTTRVITIGWRGLERNFLDMWKNRNDLFDLMVVSGSEESSEETVENLEAGEMVEGYASHARIAFKGGFGDMMSSGELQRFFGRQET